jgi:hypothetical protein
MNEISLTSCPAEVGLLIKLDSETLIELRPVVMVADALSGPSEPVPDAVAVNTAALAGAALSKSMAVVKAIADPDLNVLISLSKTNFEKPHRTLNFILIVCLSGTEH